MWPCLLLLVHLNCFRGRDCDEQNSRAKNQKFQSSYCTVSSSFWGNLKSLHIQSVSWTVLLFLWRERIRTSAKNPHLRSADEWWRVEGSGRQIWERLTSLMSSRGRRLHHLDFKKTLRDHFEVWVSKHQRVTFVDVAAVYSCHNTGNREQNQMASRMKNTFYCNKWIAPSWVGKFDGSFPIGSSVEKNWFSESTMN